MKHTLVIQGKDDIYHGLSYIQTKIITEVIKLRNIYYQKNNFFFDNMFVSTSMFNLLSDHNLFHATDVVIYDDELTHSMGMIGGMKIFIDPSVNRNQIRISVDKSRLRDIKINSIVESDYTEKILEIIVDIESDLI